MNGLIGDPSSGKGNLAVMEKTIIAYINKQKVATICCIDEVGNPYCFSSFFVLDPIENLLHFKSSSGTRHAALMRNNAQVAGTINPDKLNVLAIKGIQFEGKVVPFEDVRSTQASNRYHVKYPFALAKGGDVWTIQLTHIKMTDSSQVFGKKITWSLHHEATI